YGALLDLLSFPTRRSSDLFIGAILTDQSVGTRKIAETLCLGDSVFEFLDSAHKLLKLFTRNLHHIDLLVFAAPVALLGLFLVVRDRKSTRLNSSHVKISYA